MLKAGWYLDTTVEINGLKQKVGVYDGDSNLRLGDVAQPQISTTRAEKNTGISGQATTCWLMPTAPGVSRTTCSRASPAP